MSRSRRRSRRAPQTAARRRLVIVDIVDLLPERPTADAAAAALDAVHHRYGRDAVVVVADAAARHRAADRDAWDRFCLRAGVLCPPAGTVGGLGAFLSMIATRAHAAGRVAMIVGGRPVPDAPALERVRYTRRPDGTLALYETRPAA